MQNIPYVRTAADLERKYNLSALPTIEKNTKTNQEQILKTNTMLEEFTAETIKNLENLQDQVDGNVTTYYYSGVPTLLNPPVSDWKEEEYNVHLGDLYYDKDTGYAYRFYLDTEPNVYGWVRITDSDITEALAIANTAQDTADAKRRVFVVEPKPPYDVGDIWFKEDKDLFRCKLGRQKGDSFNNSDWILATNYTDDTAANEAKAELSDYKVYVETTYETQADFIKEKEALELKVSKVETVANDKNKVFTSEPTTPYLPGDVYIKETTVEGMKQNLIYVCQTGRESGDYNPNDFSLQPSYASQSDLKLTDNKIAGVVQSVETLEKEVTTIKETNGNNSLYVEDALESRVLEYGIDGKSEQDGTPTLDTPVEIKNVEGIRNLIDVPKGTQTINGVEVSVDDNYVITFNGTCTTNNSSFKFNNNLKQIKLDGIYTLHYQYLGGSISGNMNTTTIQIQETTNWTGIIVNLRNSDNKNTKTLNAIHTSWNIRFDNGTVFNNYKIKVQLEKSSVAHSIVPYGSWSNIKITDKDILNNIVWEQGSLSSSSGLISGANNRIRTPYIQVEPNTTYTFSQRQGYQFIIFEYRDNDEYIGRIYEGWLVNTKYEFTTTSDTKKIRVVIAKEDSSNIIPSEISKVNAEIYTKENITLIDMNKPNLFDKDNVDILNLYPGTTFGSNTKYQSICIPIEPNTTYTLISLNHYSDGLTLGTSEEYPVVDGKTTNSLSVAKTKNNITITSGANDKYLLSYILWGTSISEEILNGIKIYKGIGIDDNYELCSIGDIKDTLIVNSDGTATIEKKIGKVILDGSESWSIASSVASGTSRFSFDFNRVINSGVVGDTKIYTISDKFVGTPWRNMYSIDTTSQNLISNYTDNVAKYNRRLYIRISNTIASDVDTFKTWLSNNNVEVYYVLAEPYTIDLGQVDISLFENINHINLLDDIETDTRVKYLINNVMNGTYATKSELVIETNKINSSLSQKVSSEELDETLEELSNSITQEITDTENTIMAQVNKKVNDEDLTGAELILRVNNDSSEAQLNADKISLEGKTINLTGDNINIKSTNFNVDKNGNIIARNGKFTGGELILEDDGTSTNASIKIQTKDTSTGSTITRETTYSGYGIESDITTNYDYTEDDVTAIQNIIINHTTPTQEQLDKYDISGDGKIDVLDMSKIRKIVLMRISKDSPGHFSIDTHASFNDNIVITNGLKEKVVSIGLNGVESIGGNLYYRDGEEYFLDGYVGGGYVTGSGTGFNLGTIFTPKSLSNIESVTLNEGATLTVRQGGKYLVGSATAGASMSLKHCYAQKLGDNAIGVYFNAPSAPTGVTNNDAIGVVMSNLSFTLNGYADEE